MKTKDLSFKTGMLLGLVIAVLSCTAMFFGFGNQIDNLDETITTQSGTIAELTTDYESALEMGSILLDFTEQTTEYLNCSWSAQRGEQWFSECNSYYNRYKEDYNALNDYGLVENRIYDA